MFHMHPFGDLFFAGGLRLSVQDHYKRVPPLWQLLNAFAESGFNGGSPAGYTYVPNEPGIDYALDSHYSPNMAQGGPGFFQHDFHQWNDNSQVMVNLYPPVNRQSGAILEWGIRVDAIGSSFTWFAATHDYAGNIFQLTWDRTGSTASAPAPVPAPSAGLLFASALPGLCLARRRLRSRMM
jgi:hypothetical protein